MKPNQLHKKIILPGGAGLVGQNLVARLKQRGYTNICVIDKHKNNLNTLQKLHPDIITVHADLSIEGEWIHNFDGAQVVVMLQAQIGGLFYREFELNNITSTERILDIVKQKNIQSLVHISSSVVESSADDFYTNSKKEQEQLVLKSGINCPILRPTLMFGWFDRKHLGWLARFMKKVPIFPIPGNGRYMRQPLYVGDFCDIIISCIENNDRAGIFNISGREKIDYIDIIKEIKRATRSRTPILKIPYRLFYYLLSLWALFDRNPPFTTQQLEALIAKDEFEIINWPSIFDIEATSFKDAIEETFTDDRYSNVELDF